MRLCRYDDNRLGLVRGETLHDVTAALDLLPALRWPLPPGDLLIQRNHIDDRQRRVYLRNNGAN